MQSKFEVVYKGLQDGISDDEFIAKFCSKFGISESKAEKIVASNGDIVVKKDLDEIKAKKYLAAFEACGMVAVINEIAVEEDEEELNGFSLEPMGNEEAEVEQTSAEIITCPKCGSRNIKDDQCNDCGIYLSKYQQNIQSSSEQSNNDEFEEADEKTDVRSNITSDETNPYATPEAPLESISINKDGQGTLEGGINGDYELRVGDVFSEAWEKSKGAKGSFLLAWLLYIIVAVVVNIGLAFISPDTEMLMQQGRFTEGMLWSILPGMITIPILYPILAGITLMGLHRAVDAEISGTSVFSHYNKIIPITILTAVTSGFVMVGMMLLVIPGLYLLFAYMMALALMMDRDMGVWEALETSRKAITKHWFKVFWIYFLMSLLFIAASLPMMIGLIWVLPLMSIMHGVMYKIMFGVESAE
ncbi:hypothetical protein [sulfur-oxidizing endosymbiont of Gigantopelta aegis]|uniref:hypothetical protein n=1 Tax=sulfur-oxidizing endosymbiont of Gigantopelta aegis TaxID=2794934 RepID=UPI0018DDB0D0|nr:hypothetical protein [sulfur-oxidizing endosymbiont of Gigantopelta aegis]